VQLVQGGAGSLTGGQAQLVTAAPAAATGTVQFKDGTAVIGTAQLSGGAAAFATSSRSQGTHSIRAVYLGIPT
jgi:hypothetical protein